MRVPEVLQRLKQASNVGAVLLLLSVTFIIGDFSVEQQWRHFSQTLGGLTFDTQLLLRVRYCNAWQTIMQNIDIIGKNIANSYASIIYHYD